MLAGGNSKKCGSSGKAVKTKHFHRFFRLEGLLFKNFPESDGNSFQIWNSWLAGPVFGGVRDWGAKTAAGS
jgi:hypothetical protein